jgi:endogenous inhibitor of DNA gyrase (YacG/DUF329 family)
MRLSAAELAYVRSQGLYITEKCDGCPKVLNQTVRYTITGRPEVFCSAECRDKVFFADLAEAKERPGSRVCASCGTSLQNKNHGALYCSNRCRMRDTRKQNAATPKNAHNDLAKSITSEPQKGRSIPSPVQTESNAANGAKREIGYAPARGGEGTSLPHR